MTTEGGPLTEVRRAGLAARAFALAVLVPLAVLSGSDHLTAVAGLVVVALVVGLVVLRTRVPVWQVAVAEGAVVGLLVVLAHPEATTLAPYLVVPVLAAALDRGRPGMLAAATSEAVVLLLAWAAIEQRWSREYAAGATLWLAAALGVGWMAVSLRRALEAGEDEQPYRSAVALIRRLEALSGRLSGGLDAVRTAEQLMDLAEDLVPLRAAGVFVRASGGAVVPVRFTAGTAPGTMDWAAEMSERCWEYEAVMLRERRLALPLAVNDEIVAVLVLEAVRPVLPDLVPQLRHQLARPTVQLQAALLFGRVRDTATAAERARIAREVHDGVAQDVAGLGYLVDNLLLTATDDTEQHDRLLALRREVSRVVTELRYSVFDLRQEQAASSGLGESVAAYANQVSGISPMAVHVTLDEEGPRLPRDQEFELVRIAQEAMTNARKHAGAGNLWVRCTVRAPYAEIEVADDGTRDHAPRSDSQGLKIMHERAEAIGAALEVHPPVRGASGTRVRVRVGDLDD